MWQCYGDSRGPADCRLSGGCVFFLVLVSFCCITLCPLAGSSSSVLFVCRPHSPRSLCSAGFLLANQVEKLPAGKIRAYSAPGKQFSYHTAITGDGHSPNLCPSVPLVVFFFFFFSYGRRISEQCKPLIVSRASDTTNKWGQQIFAAKQIYFYLRYHLTPQPLIRLEGASCNIGFVLWALTMLSCFLSLTINLEGFFCLLL